MHTVRMRSSPLILLLSLLSSTALAQPVEVPRNVEAGSIEGQIKARQVPQASTAMPKGYTSIVVPQGADKIKFTLRKITLDGVGLYKPDHFVKYYENKIGKEIKLAELYIIADRIRREYHEDGYVLTQVFLPEQDIANGAVLIHVTEGYLARVRWEGQEIKDPLIANMAAQLTRSRPFSSRKLEDVMLRINELPGITATSALEPMPAKEAEEGAVGLAITVSRKRVSGSVSVDDYASRYLGVWQSTARIESYGLLTDLDKLSYIGSSSADPSRLLYNGLQYSIPVHESGTSIFLRGSKSATHPGFRLASLDIFSESENYDIGILQPIWRSREESLDMSLQFSMRSQETKVFDLDFSEDRLRVLTWSTNYNLMDEWLGANIFSVDVSQGLNIFNATETGQAGLSRTRGHSDYTKINVNASRLQTIDEDFSVLLAATGQKTSASLLSSEQFGFGGPQFGRGYDSSEISGDEGIAASTELRWQAMRGEFGVQPFIFYDIGAVKDKQPFATSVSAASMGFGSRFQWDRLYLDTNIALPLTFTPATPKLGAEEKDPRLNVSMGVKF